MQIFEPPPEPPPRAARRVPRLPSLPALSRLAAPLALPRWSAPPVLRRPFAWLVAGEVAVTLAFVLAAIHLLSASLPSTAATGPLVAPPSPPPSAAAPDVARLLPPAGSASPRPQPGLGQSSGFLGGLLSGLNQDQASFEHQEWSALQALSGAIRTYIEDVVLPAVERAAHGGASSRSP